MVRKLILFIVGLFAAGLVSSSAQSYDEEKIAMTNFIVRMYRNAPFEGVKVFTDYENSYLLSVLSLDPAKYPDSSAMNRVASVKAMSQASRYFSGSDITSDIIIRSTERADGTADTEIIEMIKERSAGYVKALEYLTSFEIPEKRIIFIFCKEIDSANQ